MGRGSVCYPILVVNTPLVSTAAGSRRLSFPSRSGGKSVHDGLFLSRLLGLAMQQGVNIDSAQQKTS